MYFPKIFYSVACLFIFFIDMCFFQKVCLFIYLKDRLHWQKEREEKEKESVSKSSSISWFTSQMAAPARLCQTEARSQELLVPPCGWRDASWAIFACSPGHISKELAHKWSSWTWTGAHMGYQCYKWQLYLLHYNINPRFIEFRVPPVIALAGPD